MPEEVLNILRDAFITSESNGSAGDYKLVIKVETLDELQNLHRKLLQAVRDSIT